MDGIKASAEQLGATIVQVGANFNQAFTTVDQNTARIQRFGAVFQSLENTGRTGADGVGQFKNGVLQLGQSVAPAETRLKALGQAILQNATSFGIFSASVFGIIASLSNLQRQSLSVETQMLREQRANTTLRTAQLALNEARDRGNVSAERIAVLESRVADARQRTEIETSRTELAQGNYNEAMGAFVTQIVPQLVTAGASGVQMFSGMSKAIKDNNISLGGIISSIKNFISPAQQIAPSIGRAGDALNQFSNSNQNLTKSLGLSRGAMIGMAVGAGAAIATFAIGVVNAFLSIQRANEEMSRAVKAGDWDAALKAKLAGLRTETEDPFGIILNSFNTFKEGLLTKPFEVPANISQLEKDLVLQLIDVRDAVKSEMEGPEWSQAFAFPKTITSGIDADAKTIEGKIKGMVKNLEEGITLDPTYIEQFGKDLENLLNQLKLKVAAVQADFQEAVDSRDAKKIGSFIFVDEATLKENQKTYNDNLAVAIIAAKKYRAEQAQGYKGSVDDFINIYTAGMSDAQKALLKQTIENDDKRIQAQRDATTKEVMAMFERTQAVKDALEAENLAYADRVAQADAMKAQREREAQEIIGMENTIAEALGKRINLATFDFELGKKIFEASQRKVEGYKEEELA